MTCNGCRKTVENILSGVPAVKTVKVDLAKKSAEIESSGFLSLEALKQALEINPQFQISEAV